MSHCATYLARPDELDRGIAQCAAAAASFEKRRDILTKEATRVRRNLIYLRAIHRLRAPANTYNLWRFGVLLVGAATAAVLGFIALYQLSGSYPLAISCAMIGALATDGLLVALFRWPADSELPDAIANSTNKYHDANLLIEHLIQELIQANRTLQDLSDERVKLLSSIAWQRAALLNQNWKAMRDAEWEEFLVKVLNALGAAAHRIGKSGDQGVDLIVECEGQRIAVQAKGYYHAVNNKAVQEVVAGKAHHGCTVAMVITNSRFARSAIELAQSNDCILIGEDEFLDFAMGTSEFLKRRTST